MINKIKKIQTAVFTRDFNLNNDISRAQLLLDLDKNVFLKKIFDAPLEQVPIPSDAPQEIPRVMLKSNDNKFRCNIALSRTDLIFNILSDNVQSLDDLLEIQKNNSKDVIRFLIDRNALINRIGFITVVEKLLTFEEGNSGRDYLKSNFILEDKFNNPKELILRYNYANRSKNFDMNNSIIIDGKSDNKITLQTDINTTAELMNTASFKLSTLDEIDEIIDYAIIQSKKFIYNFPNI